MFHVAGTNGKGSTCAFLRAALEAQGYRVHVYTSPHPVRFNERIRLAGTLIGDEELAPLLAEVLDVGGDIGASFFEVTTAAAFLAFSRIPADACVIEVGLGGRLDATNVLRQPAVCGIAALGIDHQAFLGDTLVGIAGEKAGIAKPGVSLVTMAYPPDITARVVEVATAAAAPVRAQGTEWHFRAAPDHLAYADEQGELVLPLPALPGAHQAANLALATAMLREQAALPVSPDAIASAARSARWPARMQHLAEGPLTARLPDGADLWLDGGHNPDAGAAIARLLPSIVGTASHRGRPLHLILGMLANKDAAGLLGPIAPFADALTAVPVPDHEHHSPADLARTAHGAGHPYDRNGVRHRRRLGAGAAARRPARQVARGPDPGLTLPCWRGATLQQ